MLAVGIIVACRSPKKFRGSSSLPCQNYTFSGGFLESCLGLPGFTVLYQIVFFSLLFLALFLFSIGRRIQAFKEPWLSILEASSGSGMPVFIFVLRVIHTRGLYKVRPRLHASCFSSARIRTRAILVTVACLKGYFLFRVGPLVALFSTKIIKKNP
jgi:hypothetical protein